MEVSLFLGEAGYINTCFISYILPPTGRGQGFCIGVVTNSGNLFHKMVSYFDLYGIKMFILIANKTTAFLEMEKGPLDGV